MVCSRCGDVSLDLVFLYGLGRPELQDHLLKVNHILFVFFGRLFLPRMFVSVWKKTSILVIKQV